MRLRAVLRLIWMMTFSIGLPFFKSFTEVAAIYYSLINPLQVSMFDGITRIVAKYKFEPIRSTTLATLLQYYLTSLYEWDISYIRMGGQYLSPSYCYRYRYYILSTLCFYTLCRDAVPQTIYRHLKHDPDLQASLGRFIDNHIFKLKCKGRDYNKIVKICGQKIRSTSYATKPDSLGELQDLLVQTEFSLCVKCSTELKCKVDNERRRIWDMLSSLRLAPHGIN
ncbi:hypothetical protein M422DRAFT_50260 [Sphaerobolus stellatus SS14]|uniref:Uncharacterized protein n=1 Tax=Sphaerobolus stellatus (strain SS14) TaxID=990650 RepID=A0A0C9U4I6_SPHS4|nr:hypothetical protein M422DRAFT_50260 [Sphaerobolus stellatus SS14]